MLQVQKVPVIADNACAYFLKGKGEMRAFMCVTSVLPHYLHLRLFPSDFASESKCLFDDEESADVQEKCR